MEISGAEQIRSIQQAISMVSMRNALNQDANSVDRMVQGLEELDKAMQESSSKAALKDLGLGVNVDTRV